MATLYIDRRHAELDFLDGQLRVREPDGRPHGYPIAGLERLVIHGNARATTGLLTRLAEQGVYTLLLNGRGGRRHAQVAAFRHGDALRRLGQYRLCSDQTLLLRWARLLVRERGRRLLRLYREALAQRPDLHHPLSKACAALRERLAAIPHAASLASLRGIEGAIAAAHFAAYATLFPPACGFSGRNRRPPRDPVNAALSLGYTLTHADAVHACLVAGLDPMLGTLHEPSHGRESLACDLNELARNRVERLVWRLFADGALRPGQFEVHGGGVSLNKASRQVFWAAFEAQAAWHRRQLRTVAGALARHCRQLAASHRAGT